MAMLQYASGIFNSAVTEASKCFAAPIDHTRPDGVGIKQSNPHQWDSKKQPSVPNPFDSALSSDGNNRPIALSNGSRPSMSGPSSSRYLNSATMANGCSAAKEAEPARPTSSLSVVVVEKDGSKRVSSSVNLPVPSYAEETNQSHFTSNPNALEDTLTMRTSGGALAKETEKSLKQLFTLADLAEQDLVQEVEARSSWQIGSVLEVFSASLDRWYPALVMQLAKKDDAAPADMLTVQFWLDIDVAKQKRLSRSDANLAPLGTHCRGQLPPGFELRASRSRPGEFVFSDATNGLKYESADLAWAAHFQRWLEYRAPAGTETIRSVAAVVSVAANEKRAANGNRDKTPTVRTAPPTPSKMDVTSAYGLVTEHPATTACQYEMSREIVAPTSPSVELTTVNTTIHTSRGAAQPGPIGLVTEYESDWAAVSVSRDDAPEACKPEEQPQLRELSTSSHTAELLAMLPKRAEDLLPTQPEDPAECESQLQDSCTAEWSAQEVAEDAEFRRKLKLAEAWPEEPVECVSQMEEPATNPEVVAHSSGEDATPQATGQFEDSATAEAVAETCREDSAGRLDDEVVYLTEAVVQSSPRGRQLEDSASAEPVAQGLSEDAASVLEDSFLSETEPATQTLGEDAASQLEEPVVAPPMEQSAAGYATHQSLATTVPSLGASPGLLIAGAIPQHSAPAVTAVCETMPTEQTEASSTPVCCDMATTANDDETPAEPGLSANGAVPQMASHRGPVF